MTDAVERKAEAQGSLLDLCGVLEPEAAEELARAIEQNRRMRGRARRGVP